MNHPVQLSHCSLSCKNRMRSGLTAPSLILSLPGPLYLTFLFNFAHPSQLNLQWASCNIFELIPKVHLSIFKPFDSLSGLLPLNEGCRKSGTNYKLLSFIQ
jgi:hypothetical protein